MIHKLELRNSAFESNKAGKHGGGILVHGPNTECELGSNNSYVRNSAVVSGGALAMMIGPTVHITKSSFLENQGGKLGGSIWAQGVDHQTVLKIEESEFSQNNGEKGGGAFLEGPELIANSSRSIFFGNTATKGGGLFVSSGSLMDIRGTTLRKNQAIEDGGGIFAEVGNIHRVSNHEFSVIPTYFL